MCARGGEPIKCHIGTHIYQYATIKKYNVDITVKMHWFLDDISIVKPKIILIL